MKSINLNFWLIVFLFGSLSSMSQHRPPLRVQGNVQESKLIHRVEPVYPEKALAAGLHGVVILQVTINEKGEVTDTLVRSGHPLLAQSAVDAVRQWRYSPTYLNGKAVPVGFTVVVHFSIAGRVVLDERGILTDPESGAKGDALIEQLKKSRGTVIVNPGKKAPFNLIEEKLRTLQESGITVAVSDSRYVFHEGRIFYSIPGRATEPELVLDKERLIDIACASGRLQTAIDLDSNGITTLAYRLFLSETGELLSVERLQGPEIPAVEAELARTRIVTPALVGGDPAPAAVTVEIPIDYKRIERK